MIHSRAIITRFSMKIELVFFVVDTFCSMIIIKIQGINFFEAHDDCHHAAPLIFVTHSKQEQIRRNNHDG